MAEDDPKTLVSTDWLAAHLKDPDLRVLDATTFLPGDPNPVELATLPVSSPAAQYYGATAVSPETSVNLTGGVVFTPVATGSLSID